MPSKRSDTRPDARARLVAKRLNTGDRFKTLVFHITAPDYFLTINTIATPERFIDFVVVDPPVNGEIKLEIYDGQEFFGVVEWLDFYQLTDSEQCHPRIPGLYFCVLFYLFIGEIVATVLA